MATITLPQARIPLGWMTINDQRFPVEIDREWNRAFNMLVDRTGGISGDGTTTTTTTYETVGAMMSGNAFLGMKQQLLPVVTDDAAQILSSKIFGG